MGNPLGQGYPDLLDKCFKIAVTMLCCVATIILVAKGVFWIGQDADSVGKMDNETLLGLISVLVALGGVLSYIFHKVILVKIESSIEEDYRQERMLSRGDLHHILGYINIKFYKTVYKEATKTKDRRQFEGRAIELLREAIAAGNEMLSIMRRAAIDGRIMDLREKRFYCIAKNNLAYYLERKWNYYRDAMNNEEFKKYLQKKEKRGELYKAEKYFVIKLIQEAQEDIMAGNFIDLMSKLKATEDKIKKTFSV